MHNSLHPSRQMFLDEIKGKESQIDEIFLCFNYPKDPTHPRDKRVYDKNTGGTLLDLGIYCF